MTFKFTQEEIRMNSIFDKKSSLPNILLTNLQSFGKPGKTDKTSDLDCVLQLNSVDIAVFTETWATDSVLKSLDFKDYIMFHSIRKNCKRPSGGLSIFVKSSIPATKLDIHVPGNLEIMYVSVRPHKLPRSISNIILCAVYFPGTSSKFAPNQEDILIHLTESIQNFYVKYSNPLIMLLGDFNDLKIIDLCESCLLKQVVNVPTRKNAILDLIMTNIDNQFYKDPVTLPGISTSDHKCVWYVPKFYIEQKITKKTIMIRQFKKYAMIAFGSWIVNFDWSILYESDNVNDKVTYFVTVTWLMIEKFFPLKKLMISNTDKEWITPNIKTLIKQRQKAHFAKNSELFNYLAAKVRSEIRKAKLHYNEKNAHLFHMSNPREWYRYINKILGNKNPKLNFINIPELAYKTAEEQMKIVNTYFASICRKYPPLDKNIKLRPTANETVHYVSELWTYKMLKKYSKKSLGHNDFPKKILQEFAPELAAPFSNIINCALQTGIFPDEYKKAEIIPIPKVNPPRSLSDLRPISKTPIGGKMIEKAIMSELEKDIKGKLDNSQYGNCKGASTTHYLIKLTDLAFKSTDRGHATTAITIDYSKAFDYVDHNVLINKLVQFGVRGRIINLIMSFLTDRSHNTNILGNKSNFLNITCGVPQGTVTGPKLFVILINGDKCSLVHNFKFVDDKTLALSYSGDSNNIFQEALDIEVEETNKDKMIINENKCHKITFNFSKYNTPPLNLKLNGKIVEQTDQIKLLGVHITEDLKWSKNTNNICSKVNQKLYIINKLKDFGLQKEELITAWRSILRPITEYAVPLWHPGLTEYDSERIEMLQKRALAIILGTVYIDNRRLYKIENGEMNYHDALQKIGLTTLRNRREVLTNKFALDTLKNNRHSDMFQKKEYHYITTRNRLVIEEPHCNTDRYFNSAIPYMSRLINGVFMSKEK